MSDKAFWRVPSGTPTSEAIALEAWAHAAHAALVETAGAYHAIVGESALAERVQEASGIRTSRPHDRWLAKVLAPLAHLHHHDGQPPLTALVVDATGRVGERYADVLTATEQLPVADPSAREQHAARARLACYRWAGSAPADGGEPAPLVLTTRRTRAARAPRPPREPKPTPPRRVAASDRPVIVCPHCFMAVPATGVCDNCG